MKHEVLAANILRVRLLRILLMSIAFPIATLVAFWESNGVSLQQGLVLQVLFALMLAGFEVPCGYLADQLGRKKSVLLGGVALVAGAIVYGLGTGFSDFLIAEALYALGLALVSGADEALFYDSLLSAGQEERHSKLWSSITRWEFVAAALVFVVGGAVAQIDLRLAFLPTVVGLGLYVVVAAGLVEPQRQRLRASRGHLRAIVQIGRVCFVEKATLRWVFLYSAFMMASLQISFWLYQSLLVEGEVPISWNGWVFAALNIAAGISAGYAHKLQKRFGVRGCFQLAFVMQVLSLVGLCLVLPPLGITLFLVHQFNRSLLRVVIADAIQREAPSEVRSTVLSLRGLSDRVSYALLLLPFSLQAGAMSVGSLFLALAVLTFLPGAILLWGARASGFFRPRVLAKVPR